MRSLLRLDAFVPADDAERFEAWLGQRAAQGWEESETPEAGLCRFRVHLDDHPAGRAMAGEMARDWPGLRLETAVIEEEDWGAAWKEFFTPISVGGVFEVLPPWLADKAAADRVPIIIEPKMAFGTGHHPTTALCLELLAEAAGRAGGGRGGRFLDLGAGSGILGIALAKSGLVGLGLDIDPQAVFCAAENARTNDVTDVLALAAGGLECLAPGLLFDLVAANILAAPLIAMASALTARLAPEGTLVLSGILAEQAPAVAAAYKKAGLFDPEIRLSGEWAALAWDRARRAS